MRVLGNLRHPALTCLLAWGFTAACNDDAQLERRPPFLTASAVNIDFGTRDVGDTEERSVFVINKGQTPMTIEDPVGDGLGGIFTVLVGSYKVQAEEDSVLRVLFTPSDTEYYEASILIPNDSVNEPMLKLILSGTGVEPDPCDRLDCRVSPAPSCVGQNVSRRYEPLGVCVDGRCEHNFRDEDCDRGCDDETGACRGDPCAGVACNTPPSGCFFAAGTCNGGACEYMPNNEGTCDDNKPCTVSDRCEEGTCVGDQTVCETAPDPICLDAMTRQFWNPQGVCDPTTGACDYVSQQQTCEFGCTDGQCEGDPCAGVVCDMPPAGQCFDQMGTCTGGVCNYATVPGACDDGDACTSNDVCSNGACAGTAQVCMSPPAPSCAAMDTLLVYDSAGTCNGGNCEYQMTTMICDDNDACTVNDFCASGTCRSGAMNTCDDGNPCTTDSCDPVSGCINTPNSGGACTSNSSECPTGVCSAGQCLPTAGVTCVATYDICFGLSEQEVAGVCSASGDCVVSQPPPQLTCPGCAGLCVTCPIIGLLCIPL